MRRIPVGILGATGAVGQQFIRLLDGHPWFDVVALGASSRSAGKRYDEAAAWTLSAPIPEPIAAMTVEEARPGQGGALDACEIVFSGLDASVAGEIEAAFAAAGVAVVSNARNHRLDPTVPLLIPEVNPGHTALIDGQTFDPSGRGFVVTTPNCSTVGLVCALAPLHAAFGVEEVHVVTMQALSGAGYPGVASLDALGNVIPHIGGEEEKMAVEPTKLLGRLIAGENGAAARVEPAAITVSAQCNRVPVIDGHLLCVSVRLTGAPDADAVREALRTAPNPLDGLGLPSAPARWLHVFDAPDAPQTRRHVGLGGGMTVSVGRVQPCAVLGVKFVALVHNTVRGAAGGAILNAELLVAQGRVQGREQGRETGRG